MDFVPWGVLITMQEGFPKADRHYFGSGKNMDVPDTRS